MPRMAHFLALDNSLPPSKGHYVDYTTCTFVYAPMLPENAPASSPMPAYTNSNDIPIDPVLLEMTLDDSPALSIPPSTSVSIEPTSKRVKKSTSPPPSTEASTPLSMDPEPRLQSSGAPSTPHRSSSQRTIDSSPLSVVDTPNGMFSGLSAPPPADPIFCRSPLHNRTTALVFLTDGYRAGQQITG